MSLTKRLLTILGLVYLVSGCTILPTWLSVAHTGADVYLGTTTGKTSSEHVVSAIVEEDCQWSRIVIEDLNVCLTPDEETNHILSLKCEGWIAWNWFGHPYCKNNNEEE